MTSYMIPEMRIESTNKYIELFNETNGTNWKFEDVVSINALGSWTVDSIGTGIDVDSLNAFQHAYISAKISYENDDSEFSVVLGEAKELATWLIEPNRDDTNRDLWNNSIAAQSATLAKNDNVS